MKRALNPVARWLVGALLACAGQAHALGMDLPYQSFATAPDVDWIKVCGQWPAPVQAGEGGGMYRIVHATRHAQLMLQFFFLNDLRLGSLQRFIRDRQLTVLLAHVFDGR